MSPSTSDPSPPSFTLPPPPVNGTERRLLKIMSNSRIDTPGPLYFQLRHQLRHQPYFSRHEVWVALSLPLFLVAGWRLTGSVRAFDFVLFGLIAWVYHESRQTVLRMKDSPEVQETVRGPERAVQQLQAEVGTIVLCRTARPLLSWVVIRGCLSLHDLAHGGSFWRHWLISLAMVAAFPAWSAMGSKSALRAIRFPSDHSLFPAFLQLRRLLTGIVFPLWALWATVSAVSDRSALGAWIVAIVGGTLFLVGSICFFSSNRSSIAFVPYETDITGDSLPAAPAPGQGPPPLPPPVPAPSAAPPPLPAAARTGVYERSMPWLEQRAAWYLGWGDGRRPGPAYFLLNRPPAGTRAGKLRLTGDILAVLLGALFAGKWLAIAGLTLLLPAIAALLWMFARTFSLTGKLLASGLVRELAVTPVGPASVLRDIHITAVRRLALAGAGWLGGHILLVPLGPEGIMFAGLIILLMPGILWRVSVAASLAAIGLDNWRPSPAVLRRALVVGALSVLLLLLMLVIPPLLLVSIGLRHGENAFVVWIPLALAPGLLYTAGLIRWLKRKGLNVDVGQFLTLDAERVRHLIETKTDL